jgi:hypothetical protein
MPLLEQHSFDHLDVLAQVHQMFEVGLPLYDAFQCSPDQIVLFFVLGFLLLQGFFVFQLTRFTRSLACIYVFLFTAAAEYLAQFITVARHLDTGWVIECLLVPGLCRSYAVFSRDHRAFVLEIVFPSGFDVK